MSYEDFIIFFDNNFVYDEDYYVKISKSRFKQISGIKLERLHMFFLESNGHKFVKRNIDEHRLGFNISYVVNCKIRRCSGKSVPTWFLTNIRYIGHLQNLKSIIKNSEGKITMIHDDWNTNIYNCLNLESEKWSKHRKNMTITEYDEIFSKGLINNLRLKFSPLAVEKIGQYISYDFYISVLHYMR